MHILDLEYVHHPPPSFLLVSVSVSLSLSFSLCFVLSHFMLASTMVCKHIAYPSSSQLLLGQNTKRATRARRTKVPKPNPVATKPTAHSSAIPWPDPNPSLPPGRAEKGRSGASPPASPSRAGRPRSCPAGIFSGTRPR